MVCSVNQYFSGFFVGVSRFYLSNICYVNRDRMKNNREAYDGLSLT